MDFVGKRRADAQLGKGDAEPSRGESDEEDAPKEMPRASTDEMASRKYVACPVPVLSCKCMH